MKGTMSVKIYENEKGDKCFEADLNFVDINEVDKVRLIADIMKALKIDPYMVAFCAPVIEEMNKKSEAIIIDHKAMNMYKGHEKDEGGVKA